MAGSQFHAIEHGDFAQKDLLFAELLLDAARYQYEKDYDPLALPLIREADRICLNSMYQEARSVRALHPLVLCLRSVYENFAGIAGRINAKRTIERALEINERYLNAGYPNESFDRARVKLAVLLGHLTDAYLQSEELANAEEVLERSIKIFQRTGGETQHSFRLGRLYIQKSFLLATTGLQSDIAQALALSAQGLTLIQTCTTTHPQSVTPFKFLRAVLLFNAGNIVAALRLHEEVLARRKCEVGDGHHETLTSFYCVAVCWMQMRTRDGLERAEYVNLSLHPEVYYPFFTNTIIFQIDPPNPHHRPRPQPATPTLARRRPRSCSVSPEFEPAATSRARWSGQD